MTVSVISPSRNRPEALRRLYDIFTAQSFDDKEILIHDDSAEPHPFYQRLEDPRVRYVHSPRRVALGEKRNALIDAARGDVIVQFDDDDFYSRGYISAMIGWLEHCDFVTLSAWFAAHAPTGGYYYWQTHTVDDVHFRIDGSEAPSGVSMKQTLARPRAWANCQLWGYGFSYVFRKQVARAVRFDSTMTRGEDLAFATAARTAGFTIRAFADTTGLAMHLVHPASTSRIFPNYRIPDFMIRGLFGVELSQYLAAARVPATRLAGTLET